MNGWIWRAVEWLGELLWAMVEYFLLGLWWFIDAARLTWLAGQIGLGVLWSLQQGLRWIAQGTWSQNAREGFVQHRYLLFVTLIGASISGSTPFWKQDTSGVQTGQRLSALRSTDFDLQRLIRLCEEIDISFQNECWHAVTALTREVLDHVPPIFGYGKFEHVANNYGGNGSSFKRSMQHLQRSLRNIADVHLHTPIRKSENLPTATQVNFANDLDVLLGEIVRVLR